MRKFLRFNYKSSLASGFTLVELLIVLAIIGVLTSFLLANLIGTKARARDAQRKSDIRQMQVALEQYRTDQGTYPASPLPGCNQSLVVNGATYIQKMPCDPLSATAYTYTLGGGGSSYTLLACLENKNDTQGAAAASCSSGWGFQVTNP